jgi:hypothetical protein
MGQRDRLDPAVINSKFLEKLKGLSKEHPLYKEYMRIQERINDTKKGKAR